MTIKKIKDALSIVEDRVNTFYKIRTRKSLEEAIETIQDFEYVYNIMLYEEMDALAKHWRDKG